MIIHKFEQNTPEWHAIRIGKFTASLDFQQLVTGKPEVFKKLVRKKAAERITGQEVVAKYSNKDMERGKELEESAIEAFEMEKGLSVDRVGFIEGSNWHGVSPDGLVGADAGIEIKAKDIHTHLDCFFDGYDKSYKWQIQGNLFVAERDHWWFVSYNPHYAHIGKHLYIEKIQRDEAVIEQIRQGIERGKLAAIAAAKVMTPEEI